MSEKRLNTGLLTKDVIFEFIRKLKPEQVFLARFNYPDHIINYLKEEYRLIHSSFRKKLFVSKEIFTVDINAPLVGYGKTTTGGYGGKKVIVSTLLELKRYAGLNSPYIIYVSGKLSGDDAVSINSNKSIIGLASTAHLEGIGLKIKDGVSNVIVQNMVISKVKATNDKDAIQIKNGAHHIWIDHCELYSDREHEKDFYDGLVDISVESNYVTISWCIFHDHYKTILIGHSDSATDDRGKLKVTLHHNYFYNIHSRTPSLRFGVAHVFNNYFKAMHKAISSRMDACIRVEQNYFENVKFPIRTDESPISGNVQLQKNEIIHFKTDKTFPTCNFIPPYKYENILHRASDVPAIAVTNAGAVMNIQQ
jgi:pectate lyase